MLLPWLKCLLAAALPTTLGYFRKAKFQTLAKLPLR